MDMARIRALLAELAAADSEAFLVVVAEIHRSVERAKVRQRPLRQTQKTG